MNENEKIEFEISEYRRKKKKEYQRQCYDRIKNDPVKYETMRARKRAYYLNNRETILAQKKEWAEAHKDYLKVYRKNYYESNRECISLARKEKNRLQGLGKTTLGRSEI